MLESWDQLQRVQRKQEHRNAQAPRIVHLDQVVEQVAGEYPQFIRHVRIGHDGAALLELGPGLAGVHGTTVVDTGDGAFGQADTACSQQNDSAQQAQNAHHGAYDDRQTDWTNLSRPKVLLVQAREFVMHLAKRERLVTTLRWRMCPST